MKKIFDRLPSILFYLVIFCFLLSQVYANQEPESKSESKQEIDPYLDIYVLSPEQNKSIKVWRRAYLRGSKNLFKKMDVEQFHLFRYGSLDQDYIDQVWPRGFNTLASSLVVAENPELRRDILLFLIDKDAEKCAEVLKKAKKTEKNEQLQVIIDWGLWLGQKKQFEKKLVARKSKILKEIKYQEFMRLNGQDYPTALQQVNFAATDALLLGLENPDWRLRLHYLYTIKNLKTRLNRKKILNEIIAYSKKEKNSRVQVYYKYLIEYYRQ